MSLHPTVQGFLAVALVAVFALAWSFMLQPIVAGLLRLLFWPLKR